MFFVVCGDGIKRTNIFVTTLCVEICLGAFLQS